MLASQSIWGVLVHLTRLPHRASGKTPCSQDARGGEEGKQDCGKCGAHAGERLQGFGWASSARRGRSRGPWPGAARALPRAPSAARVAPPPRAALGGWVPAPSRQRAGGRAGPDRAAWRRGARAPRTHAAGRAARFPSPAARSASRRDVTGRPPAPRSSGQSACGRRAHGPAGRAGSGLPGPGGAARGRERGWAPAPPGARAVDFLTERDVSGPGDLRRRLNPPSSKLEFALCVSGNSQASALRVGTCSEELDRGKGLSGSDLCVLAVRFPHHRTQDWQRVWALGREGGGEEGDIEWPVHRDNAGFMHLGSPKPSK